MRAIRLADVLPNLNTKESYVAYRYIEDWCQNNIPYGRWKFEHSSTISAYGVDIPSRIFFWSAEDAVIFRIQCNNIDLDYKPLD